MEFVLWGGGRTGSHVSAQRECKGQFQQNQNEASARIDEEYQGAVMADGMTLIQTFNHFRGFRVIPCPLN
jgi:hypothetical protein